MRWTRKALLAIGLVALRQILVWGVRSTGQRSPVVVSAAEWHFEHMRRHAEQFDPPPDAKLGTLVMTEAAADDLGLETFESIRRLASDYRIDLEIGSSQYGQFQIHRVHDNPFFASVDIGEVAGFCAITGQVDFFYLMGMEVRVPDKVSEWVRETVGEARDWCDV